MTNREQSFSGTNDDMRVSIDYHNDDMLKSIAQEELELSNEERVDNTSSDQAHRFDLKSIADQIKSNNNRTSTEVFHDILASVAMEQVSISYLIQAEANKIRAFTGVAGDFPTMPSNQNINDFQVSIARVLEAIVEKQKLLIRMVEVSKRIVDEGEVDG